MGWKQQATPQNKGSNGNSRWVQAVYGRQMDFYAWVCHKVWFYWIFDG